MFDAWQTQCLRIIHALLGKPGSGFEVIISWVVVILALVLVMRAVGHSVGIPTRGEVRELLALVGGTGIAIAAAAFARICLVPHGVDPMIRWAILAGVPFAAVLLIAIPVQMLLLKARYHQAFTAFFSAVIAAGGILFLTQMAFESLSIGKLDTAGLRHHKASIERFLNQ